MTDRVDPKSLFDLLVGSHARDGVTSCPTRACRWSGSGRCQRHSSTDRSTERGRARWCGSTTDGRAEFEERRFGPNAVIAGTSRGSASDRLQLLGHESLEELDLVAVLGQRLGAGHGGLGRFGNGRGVELCAGDGRLDGLCPPRDRCGAREKDPGRSRRCRRRRPAPEPRRRGRSPTTLDLGPCGRTSAGPVAAPGERYR